MKKQTRYPFLRTTGIIALLCIGQVTLNYPVQAAPLSATTVRFDRMKVGVSTTGTVCTTPVSTATEAGVIVSFPTGYGLGTAASFSVSTTNLAWPANAQAWPGIAAASSVSGQNVTFASGDLTPGTLYCFNWTNAGAVTVPGTAGSSLLGSVTTQTSAPAAIDSGQFATAAVTNDQIVVTATVPPSFSFALNANTDAISTTLSSATVASSGSPRTVTVNTNAKSGWNVWAKSANTGLTSPTAGATIPSTTPGTNSTLTAGTPGYNTGITSSQAAGTGTITVQAPFVGGATGKGGGLDASLRTLATSNGTANNGVLTLTNNAAISALTPAANDYSDTITLIGAGLF